MRFFLRFALTATILYVLLEYQYLTGITFEKGTASLLVFIFILGLVNLIIGGTLRLITFPIRWLSFGIVGTLIGVVVVYITDQLVDGVTISSFLSLLMIALVMGLVTMIIG